jgi:hypothetical protein
VRGRRAFAAIACCETWQKPAFHRHFCVALIFLCAVALPKNFFAAHFADYRGAAAAGTGARHLHTKLSEVTIIFFLL